MKPMVFVHMNADGVYRGNGGFRSLTSLAQAIGEMGYRTYAFDQRDRLQRVDFEWLSWDCRQFNLCDVAFLSRQQQCVVVSSWLNRLMPGFGTIFSWDNIRYHERGELTRAKYAKVRDQIIEHCPKIAINNRSLAKHYVKMGFKEIVPLENWFRRELFYYGAKDKVGGTVGFQRDAANKGAHELLVPHFPVILCEGTQKRVARRMRGAEFYVFANRPKGAVTLFRGETFGNSLYEAMACGCVVVAVKHEGNKYLGKTIPLVHNVSEAITLIKAMSEKKKAEIRERSLALIETRFRLNDEKKANIERLLR